MSSPHPAGAVSEPQLGTLAHLVRRLIGEGDRQELVATYLLGLDRYAMRDSDARFARAGSGENQQRPVARASRPRAGPG